MKLNKLSVYFGLLGIFMTFLMSCTETSNDSIDQFAQVNFVGSVLEDKEIVSRAPMSSYIYWKDFETNFYIEMQTEGNKYLGTYHINELVNGILLSHDNDPLNWHSPYYEHSFYAWTMPWVEYDPYFNNQSDGSVISFLQDGEMYKGLETFIGAKNGPLTYDKNGQDVSLQFQHLVSKIKFEEINYSYVKDDGSVETIRNIGGKIQFINMPSTGKFTRIADGRPVVEGVEGDENSSPTEYSISSGNYIYICPDVDFSKVEFRMTASSVPDNDFGSAGDFIGDFKQVTFERDVENDWWDSQRPSLTTLYAGEEMTLRMTLVRGGGVFVKVAISNWNTGLVREGTTYPYQGIFNASDFNIFYNTFNKGYDPEDEERMFDIYGETDEKGNPEYRVYEDITSNLRHFSMGKKCWLNGMGHTLTLTHPTPYGPDANGDRYYNFPRMKDIYLADNQGHMLYIDKDFKVWIVNEDGSVKKATDNNGEQYEMGPLDEGKNSYFVDIITGKITQTEKV